MKEELALPPNPLQVWFNLVRDGSQESRRDKAAKNYAAHHEGWAMTSFVVLLGAMIGTTNETHKPCN